MWIIIILANANEWFPAERTSHATMKMVAFGGGEEEGEEVGEGEEEGEGDEGEEEVGEEEEAGEDVGAGGATGRTQGLLSEMRRRARQR